MVATADGGSGVRHAGQDVAGLLRENDGGAGGAGDVGHGFGGVII